MKCRLINGIACLALIAMVIPACKKNLTEDTAALKEETVSAKKGILLDECLTNSVTLNGNSVLVGPAFGNYSAWGSVTWTIPSGPSLNLEGQFNSFLRPTTNDWYVGTIDRGDTCHDWETLVGDNEIVVKNATGNVGPDPTALVSAGPYNVVGVDGTTTSPAADYKLGYYLYNQNTHVVTVTKSTVIWTTAASGGSWPTADTSPDLASATAAYIVDVTAVNAVPVTFDPVTGAPTSFKGVLKVRYKKVL